MTGATLTAGELKPAVDEHRVAGGRARAQDPALLQHHLGVEGPPFPRTFLTYAVYCGMARLLCREKIASNATLGYVENLIFTKYNAFYQLSQNESNVKITLW